MENNDSREVSSSPSSKQMRDAIAQSLIKTGQADAPLRATPRVTLNAEVDFSSETNFFSGFSTDVAQGGLFIATLSLLPVGSTLTVRFTIPQAGEVEAVGEVRWVRAFDERAPHMFPGMGLQFIDLSPEAKAVIDTFVAQREPMFFPD